MAWCSRVSMSDVAWWTRTGRGNRPTRWWHWWWAWWETGVGFMEREVEMTSKACTQGASFGFFWKSMLAISEAQGPIFSSSVVLVWWCVDTYFGGFSLYDCCKTFRQSLLNIWNKIKLYASFWYRGWGLPYFKKESYSPPLVPHIDPFTIEKMLFHSFWIDLSLWWYRLCVHIQKYQYLAKMSLRHTFMYNYLKII
jgi:hypothetical protein